MRKSKFPQQIFTCVLVFGLLLFFVSHQCSICFTFSAVDLEQSELLDFFPCAAASATISVLKLCQKASKRKLRVKRYLEQRELMISLLALSKAGIDSFSQYMPIKRPFFSSTTMRTFAVVVFCVSPDKLLSFYVANITDRRSVFPFSNIDSGELASVLSL